MEFESANPSVVKSIRQRVLLNSWLRACQNERRLPGLDRFQPEDIADELPDMMGFAVESCGESFRFFITQEGARLTMTYGGEHLNPEQRINRYLDDALGPARYARVVPCYLACVSHRRPTYSISVVHDIDGKEVAFERLLLPFGGDGVEHIIGSYKSISIEGAFQAANLMGADAPCAPVPVVSTVISLETARQSAIRAGDEVIEAG
ncbi:hypothetical protein ACQR1W_00085 [Bradyrhizobium sp. HKCCYLS1011]|uniref:hypothetical protein n=1 Tax=Bradyrhizobium sp. HKCCYLS1011 TaxID=3420733 RepID=UPI003EBBF8DE